MPFVLGPSHFRTRVKVCGVRDVATIKQAMALGVDAVGLNFVPSSPRYIKFANAAEMLRERPVFLAVVALFMDANDAFVHQAMAAVSPDFLQFHGSESLAYCESFKVPYIKSVPMADVKAGEAVARLHSHRAAALLYDAHAVGEPGGVGRSFAWSSLRLWGNCPVILAGGLNAANVGEAIKTSKPYGVDVASGVEKVTGSKDFSLMRDFVKSVRDADMAVA